MRRATYHPPKKRRDTQLDSTECSACHETQHLSTSERSNREARMLNACYAEPIGDVSFICLISTRLCQSCGCGQEWALCCSDCFTAARTSNQEPTARQVGYTDENLHTSRGVVCRAWRVLGVSGARPSSLFSRRSAGSISLCTDAERARPLPSAARPPSPGRGCKCNKQLWSLTGLA